MWKLSGIRGKVTRAFARLDLMMLEHERALLEAGLGLPMSGRDLPDR